MKLTAKKIAGIAGDTLLGVIVLSLLYLVNKPFYEARDYTIATHLRIAQAFKNKETLVAELERLSYRNNAIPFLVLENEYRLEALKKSGIDMEVPQANFDSVDLKKSNALLLRAVEQLSDEQLLVVLKSSENNFDDAKAEAVRKNPQECSKSTARCENNVKFYLYSQLDQATKDRLKSCKIKLEEKLSNDFKLFSNLHSFGTCTDTPPLTLGDQVKSLLTFQ